MRVETSFWGILPVLKGRAGIPLRRSGVRSPNGGRSSAPRWLPSTVSSRKSFGRQQPSSKRALQRLFRSRETGTPHHYEQRLYALQPGGRIAAPRGGDARASSNSGRAWPLPPALLKRHLRRTQKVLIVEEVLPFLEDQVKISPRNRRGRSASRPFTGRTTGRSRWSGS